MKIIKNLLIFLLNLNWFCEHKSDFPIKQLHAGACTPKTFKMPQSIYTWQAPQVDGFFCLILQDRQKLSPLPPLWEAHPGLESKEQTNFKLGLPLCMWVFKTKIWVHSFNAFPKEKKKCCLATIKATCSKGGWFERKLSQWVCYGHPSPETFVTQDRAVSPSGLRVRPGCFHPFVVSYQRISAIPKK